MSGWDIGALSDIALGLFIAASGVREIVDPPPYADRASTSQLRHGESADLPATRRPRWLPGLIYILGGATICLTPHSDNSGLRTIVMLVVGGLFLLFALFELFGRPLSRPLPQRRVFNILIPGLFGTGFLTLGLIGARQ